MASRSPSSSGTFSRFRKSRGGGRKRAKPPGANRGGGERHRAFADCAGETISRWGPVRIPGTWPYTFAGLLLAPLLWSFLATFGHLLATATVEDAFWRTPQFWFFHLGAVLWLIGFYEFRGPSLVYLYVFGHEWTHGLFTVLCGGRVLQWPHISSRGGQIVTSKTNVLISLSPYVFPFYSVLVGALFFGLNALVDLGTPGEWALYLLFGLTWAFHLTFTVWMILNSDQPDLRQNGRFFSLVFILLVNVAVITLILVIASPTLSMGGFVAHLWDNAVIAWSQIGRVTGWFGGLWGTPAG